MRNAVGDEPQPEILLEDITEARSRLGRGSANGGISGVVNEWLMSLPTCMIFWLIVVFNPRMRGDVVEPMVSWLTMILIMLQKIRCPQSMGQFRGIGLLDCLGNKYVATIICVVRRTFKATGVWKKVRSFAYTPDAPLPTFPPPSAPSFTGAMNGSPTQMQLSLRETSWALLITHGQNMSE